MSENKYIVSVPDSDQTRELSREAILEELARGTITPAYWVWSPEHEDWKQISEIPVLNVPARRTPAALPPIQPITALSTPKTQPAKKKVLRRSHRVKEEEEGFSYIKALFGILYLAVAALIGLNYFLIDKPFDAALAGTPFVLVPAHAHLGSFVQPGALIIHTLPNHELNEDNLADYLCTLAKSTPPPPLDKKPFEIVALTSSWFGQYAMTGDDWQRLAAMDEAEANQRKNFITDHLANIAGQPLIRHADRLSSYDLKKARAKVLAGLDGDFSRHLTSPQFPRQPGRVAHFSAGIIPFRKRRLPGRVPPWRRPWRRALFRGGLGRAHRRPGCGCSCAAPSSGRAMMPSSTACMIGHCGVVSCQRSLGFRLRQFDDFGRGRGRN